MRIAVEATGPFRVAARLVVDAATGRLCYTLSQVGGSDGEIAGVYLHRRADRPNGGVMHVLTKQLTSQVSGVVTLLDAELADLKAGKCYLAAVSRRSPIVAARADIGWPPSIIAALTP